jgi:transcriptional regulator of arginine metabolism
MSSKPLRQKAILALLEQGPVASQEDLQRALHKRGFRVGQATLSRDIRELGLAKSAEGYTLRSSEVHADPTLPSASRLVREFVLDVKRAQNLLVIKTTVGSAQPVAAALDDEEWPGAVGSVAGDDTILIICSDKKAATRLAARTQELLA